ncbi:2OG-Fe(II) oxygenase [Sphingomonas sp. ID0503]|uniref:2OG-Fe(II) oxygenase n=1 Tax=Sphingomonas sp. ID0503 TaxID=3399691 RepID=UPI003AFB01C2
MAILDLRNAGGYLHFDGDQCAAEGEKRATQYQSAQPFPHIVMEDFLDVDVLRRVVQEYPSREGRHYFDRPQERFKYQFNPHTVESGIVRNLLAELNGEPFLKFLSAMTGIDGLISDPYYAGGGLHETLSGGHLSVHADFNVHGDMQLERRLNLLVYLNEDWDEGFGGNLELWDKKMRKAAVEVAPVMARAVVFNTSLDSYHGQPNPLTCPSDRSRRSIATYYYTALPIETNLPQRTTTFQTRPNTGDKTDVVVKYHHFVDDWVPKKLHGIARKLGPKP